ncbi:hypothetical protein Lser_V15G00548 [Lactuca serriola]
MIWEVLLEPIEMTCDPTYLVNFVELYTMLASFQSHEGRVLNSLNGINDMKSRLTSKAEYMLSGRKRMMWDISLINIKIIIPWENGKSEIHKLVLGLTAVTFSSKHDVSCHLMGSLLFHGIITANVMEGSVDSELQVNYNNIHKVLWEPFLEPWKFQVSLRREQGKSALQNNPVMTDFHLESTMNLNINVTESLIEVILTNATTMPFEVRFDIPFGVSPKILDPVYPGHEFPLPLHLSESGRIRWRPLGNTYLWSEAYNISIILSNESNIGHLRFLAETLDVVQDIDWVISLLLGNLLNNNILLKQVINQD